MIKTTTKGVRLSPKGVKFLVGIQNSGITVSKNDTANSCQGVLNNAIEQQVVSKNDTVIPPKEKGLRNLSQKKIFVSVFEIMKKLKEFKHEDLESAIWNNDFSIENVEIILDNLDNVLKHLLTEGKIIEVKPKIYGAVI